MSTGTVTYLESANMVIVNYPAEARRDCQYSINRRTGDGTLINMASAPIISGAASVDLSCCATSPVEKKAVSAWTTLIQGETHWVPTRQMSADYPGQTSAFYVPDPGRPGHRRLAVASGITILPDGSTRASVLVLTDILGRFPVPDAEDAPIINYNHPQATDGTSAGDE